MPTRKSTREEFSKGTVQQIAQQAMFICANDQCLRFTGYTTTEGKARRVADAAHIAPASDNGPGAGTRTSKALRSDASNGVWLCKICHKKVDDDPAFYSSDVLRRWKTDQEAVVRRLVGKDIEAALIELRSAKRYHDEMREVLAFFDSKRVFYEGLDYEAPHRVLESITMIRDRIRDVRSRIGSDTEFFVVLGKLQDAIHNFLRALGPNTDLTVLRCDSRDPQWLVFVEELMRFRREMNILLRPIADATGFPLRWLNDF